MGTGTAGPFRCLNTGLPDACPLHTQWPECHMQNPVRKRLTGRTWRRGHRVLLPRVNLSVTRTPPNVKRHSHTLPAAAGAGGEGVRGCRRPCPSLLGSVRATRSRRTNSEAELDPLPSHSSRQTSWQELQGSEGERGSPHLSSWPPATSHHGGPGGRTAWGPRSQPLCHGRTQNRARFAGTHFRTRRCFSGI